MRLIAGMLTSSRLTFHVSRLTFPARFLTGSSPGSYDAFISHNQQPSILGIEPPL
jgi:hypothetical protein